MGDKFSDIFISFQQSDFDNRIAQLRQLVNESATFNPSSPESAKVANIIQDVFNNGDDAVIKYTNEFDHVELTPDQLKVSKQELEAAHAETKNSQPELMAAICQSIKNVRKYQKKIFTCKSIKGKIKYTPIERVGVCVPGASAPLPSTVIMTVVPAQVADVKQIAVMSPPRYKGSIHPVILAVCHELRIDKVYRIGGVQGVAALADGTDMIGNVDMIVGPGNQWVQTAKRMLFGQIGIDSIAGPSEVLIIADDSANPAWIAADMLSQAEHAPGSAIVLTDSKALAGKVLDEIEIQVTKLDRSDETAKCLKKFSGVVLIKDLEEIIDLANDLATEHLQIQCGKRSRKIAKKINKAGAIFIGDYSPVAVGDYWAGPSHTLPTGGSARFASALSSNDFVKATSIIEYDKKKLCESADDIIRLAMVEGLDAHAKSVDIRRG